MYRRYIGIVYKCYSHATVGFLRLAGGQQLAMDAIQIVDSEGWFVKTVWHDTITMIRWIVKN